jgi:hypothetical protein
LRSEVHLNWQIYQWQEGGEIITRGRYAGQPMQSKWCPMDSYHPNVEQAAECLLKMAVLANAEKGVNLDTEAILTAITAAREDVIAAARAVTPEEFRKKSKRGRKKKEETDGQSE